MDNEGHAIAMTLTLNGSFGSALISEKYGIALNNEMDDFTTKPSEPNQYGLIQGEGNLVEPGKRPLSSMTPALVERNGRVVASLGGPGGPRIISAVLQTLYRLLAKGLDADLAVQATRVHHQFLPNTLFIDRDRMAFDVVKGLKERGHKIEEGSTGKSYLVRLRPDGILEGAFDSRGEGAAGGI
jgi:gamma-glutamyltranspeptidase/glutathione hydrolase